MTPNGRAGRLEFVTAKTPRRVLKVATSRKRWQPFAAQLDNAQISYGRFSQPPEMYGDSGRTQVKLCSRDGGAPLASCGATFQTPRGNRDLLQRRRSPLESSRSGGVQPSMERRSVAALQEPMCSSYRAPFTPSDGHHRSASKDSHQNSQTADDSHSHGDASAFCTSDLYRARPVASST